MDNLHPILDQGAALQARLRPCCRLVQVAFWRQEVAVAAPRLAAALGFTLPVDGRQVAALPEGWAFRTAPDRLLILSERERPLLEEARAAVGQAGAASDLGHARQVLDLEGSEAVPLLVRGLEPDLGPGGLVPGAFAQTRLHDAAILLHRLTEQQFRLLVPSSFAASISTWLTSAWRTMQY